MSVLIKKASNKELFLIKDLFKEYEAFLSQNGLDLCFQNFQEELDSLPGVYSESEGCIFIAYVDNSVAGCIALKKIGNQICEMKRLYVKPEFRNNNLGILLCKKLIEEAKLKKYKKMCLDTVPSINKSAYKLYQSLGFKEIEGYYNNPREDVSYMGLYL